MADLVETDQDATDRLSQAFVNFLTAKVRHGFVNLGRLRELLCELSRQLSHGHSCIEIKDCDKTLLLSSGLACENPSESALPLPLIIEENRLYLQRYWYYEDRLAKQIKILSLNKTPVDNLDQRLDRYFPRVSGEIDWQREAAKHALLQGFCIISGGPGTGKTTTICKILILLQELAGQASLSIALAAPTGKAAMRLQEALAENLAKLGCDQQIKNKIPASATTIHRLLGANPPTPYFRHHANNPLMHDVIVIDEASMVDLALMSKLVDALKPKTRLIMIGDKDQLSSVESGAVLADLISALPENTVELKHSYRFASQIKIVAEAVNRQDTACAWDVIASNNNEIGLVNLEKLIEYILTKRREYVDLVDKHADFNVIANALNRFQVLCANKYGNRGARMISRLVEHKLFPHLRGKENIWYPGRPVMVTQNAPALDLYNGDTGVCLPDPNPNGNLLVFFQRPDGGMKKYLPSRLPACETVFAMTIHKSQGSEFEEVLIVLPDKISAVLSKELVYTAITRAKTSVKFCAEKSIFMAAVNNKASRLSGLRGKLT